MFWARGRRSVPGDPGGTTGPAASRMLCRGLVGSVCCWGMRGGFPGPVVRLLAAAFALSLVGLLSWFAYFTLRAPGVVVEQVGPVRGL